MKTFPFLRPIGLVASLIAVGCGARPDFWDAPPSGAQPFALANAVAITDPSADRVVLLTTNANRDVREQAVAIQRGFRAATVAPDRSKLFVVSAGDDGKLPPAGQAAQTPALEIVTTAGHTAFPLSEALDGLALDPQGQWAVLYAGGSSSELVSNPNELLLVDLTQPPSPGVNPVSHTLRSFGGKPQRFTFTAPLELPGGSRRLLIVETEQDVALVDLLHPAAPEITIQLSSGTDTTPAHPQGVAVSDGDLGPNDARIAIREDDGNVVVATMMPATDRDFSPELNLTAVGSTPSDMAWVRTDAGALSLAVLVPQSTKAVLVDPTTGLTQDVALPAAYSSLSLVTAQSGESGSTGTAPVDVALLWNGGSGGVAFWELGRVAGRPYRSVETVGVTAGVMSVTDVGGAHPELKILGTRQATFFLLDLQARTAAPFVTSTSGVSLLPSTTGDRAWAFVQGGAQLASVDLVTLHPQDMRDERAISSLFEIAAADDALHTARSLVALTQQGTWGATVYDAAAVGGADDHTAVSGILLEGPHAP